LGLRFIVGDLSGMKPPPVRGGFESRGIPRLRLDVKEKMLPDRRSENGESLSRAIMQLIG